MSRIIQAINSMIINRDLITDVIAYNDEYFFNFLDYVWSIKRNGPRFVASRGVHLGITQKSYPLTYGYVLTFYPGYTSVSNLKSDLSQKNVVDTIRYSDETFKSQEATESFEELYKTTTERLYNVDNVLDDIISLSDKKNYKSSD